MPIGLFGLKQRIGSTFNPTSLGLSTWLDSNKGVTQGGGKASNWADTQSGAGHAVAQATGALQPAYSASGGANGRPYLQGNGSSACMLGSWSTSGTPSEVFLIASCPSGSGVAGDFFDGNTAPSTPNLRRLWLNGLGGVDAGTDATPISSGAIGETVSWRIFNIQFNGAASSIAISQAVVASGTLPTRANYGGLTLWSAGGNAGDNSNFKFDTFLEVPRILTAGERANVYQYLYALTGADGSLLKQFLFDGNSLTAGSGASGPSHYWPAVAVAAQGGAFTATTAGAVVAQYLGVGGRTTPQMTASDLSLTSTYYSAIRPKNYVFGQECTNDTVALAQANPGWTDAQIAAQAWTNYQAWIAAVKSWGGIPIAVTYTPATSAGYANFNVARGIINPLIRANAVSLGCAGVLDLAADATIGPDGAQNNTTYYQPDQVHMTDAGYLICGNLASTLMSGLP